MSDCGPRSVNEDAVGAWPIPGGVAAVVADGLGGMGGGQRASMLATQLFRTFANSGNVNNLNELGLQIHNEIIQLQATSQELRSMATTLSAVILTEKGIRGIHCGDSRISLARRSGIKRLSEEHSEAQRLFKAGKISKADLADYPRKHILESALGIHGEPKIEEIEHDLESGDRLFLTTDGFHNKIPLRELFEISRRCNTPDEIISVTKSLLIERRPDDNFSLAAVFVI